MEESRRVLKAQAREEFHFRPSLKDQGNNAPEPPVAKPCLRLLATLFDKDALGLAQRHSQQPRHAHGAVVSKPR
jgi:hypothetical protein